MAVVGGPSGSGLDRPDSLVRLAEELGIDSLVRFVPPVAQDELVDWYAASSLVCVPSYNESFGLVAVEAQATRHPGRRCRGRRPDHGGAQRLSGLLVADHEPGSYASAFERVLLEPGLRDRLAAGRRARPDFGWDRTAESMLEVYATAQQKMRADLSGIAL